jgi:hypothetical protein
MLKILFLILSAVTTGIVSLVTFAAVMASRGDIPQTAIHIEPELAPGNPLPEMVTCDRNSFFGDKLIYCQTRRDDGTLVRIVFDRRQNTITRASFKVANETIGRLILNWGEPQGYIARGRSTIEVYWDGKSVFTIAPFQPGSPVYYASFQLQFPTRPDPWKGFQTLGNP